MYDKSRTSDVTVSEYREAKELGIDVDALMQNRWKEKISKQAQHDIMTSKFGDALAITLQSSLEDSDDIMLWEMLAMNFHGTYVIGSHSEWLSAVKDKLDSGDFREKQKIRNERMHREEAKKIEENLKKIHKELVKRGIFYSATKKR